MLIQTDEMSDWVREEERQESDRKKKAATFKNCQAGLLGVIGSAWSGFSTQPKKEAVREKNKQSESVRNPGNCTEYQHQPPAKGSVFINMGFPTQDVWFQYSKQYIPLSS